MCLTNYLGSRQSSMAGTASETLTAPYYVDVSKGLRPRTWLRTGQVRQRLVEPRRACLTEPSYAVTQ